jgi:hypothetical protein
VLDGKKLIYFSCCDSAAKESAANRKAPKFFFGGERSRHSPFARAEPAPPRDEFLATGGNGGEFFLLFSFSFRREKMCLLKQNGLPSGRPRKKRFDLPTLKVVMGEKSEMEEMILFAPKNAPFYEQKAFCLYCINECQNCSCHFLIHFLISLFT